jgi:hypothetical protein
MAEPIGAGRRRARQKAMSGELHISSVAADPLWRLPLSEVMRPDLALVLQALRVRTVGDFLSAWHNPRSRPTIEQAFDQPRQAQHAAATCAAWLGVPAPADRADVPAWWCQEPGEPAVPDPFGIERMRAEA